MRDIFVWFLSAYHNASSLGSRILATRSRHLPDTTRLVLHSPQIWRSSWAHSTCPELCLANALPKRSTPPGAVSLSSRFSGVAISSILCTWEADTILRLLELIRIYRCLESLTVVSDFFFLRSNFILHSSAARPWKIYLFLLVHPLHRNIREAVRGLDYVYSFDCITCNKYPLITPR